MGGGDTDAILLGLKLLSLNANIQVQHPIASLFPVFEGRKSTSSSEGAEFDILSRVSAPEKSPQTVRNGSDRQLIIYAASGEPR